MLEDLPVLQTISNIGNIPHLSNSDPESNTPSNVNFNYFDIHKFHSSPEISSCSYKAFSLLNCNIRSIQANFDNLLQFLNDLNYPFNIISLSETWLNRANEQISNLDTPFFAIINSFIHPWQEPLSHFDCKRLFFQMCETKKNNVTVTI